MPSRPYLANPGVDRPTPFQIAPKPEPEKGGFLEFGENLERIWEGIEELPAQATAAFQQENAVVNTIELLTRPTFKPDPTFDLEANLKESGLWEEQRWDFLGVESAGEYLYRLRQIQREQKNRELLASSGADGVVLSMIAGMADPTILLPFVGPGVKGAKAFAVGAGYGLLAGGLQEIPLQLNQQLRTLEESAYSVGFSTIIGGGLGGAIGYLNRPLRDTARQLEAGMVNGRGPFTIQHSDDLVNIQTEIASTLQRQEAELKALDEEVVGVDELRVAHAEELDALRAREQNAKQQIADETHRVEVDGVLRESLAKPIAAGADVLASSDAGGLKGMLGIGERLTKLAGPVTAVLGQRISAIGRQIQAQLSTAGLRLERNLVLDKDGEIIGAIPSNEGGTIEAIVNSRRGESLRVLRQAYDNYADYVFGTGKRLGALRATRAYMAGMRNSATRLNRRQFFEEVGRAMWAGDQHAIPEVAKTAQEFRRIYDEILQEAQDTGVIPKELSALVDVSFLNRIYNLEEIARNPNTFLRLLRDHFEQALNEDFAKIADGFNRADGADKQRLADMDLTEAEAKTLLEGFRKDLAALDSANDEDIGPIEELINLYRAEQASRTRALRELQTQIRTGRQDIETLRPLRDRAAKLEEERASFKEEVAKLKQQGGADLEARAVARAALKRRIRGLNRSAFMMAEKQRGKYQMIEDLEEENLTTLNRAAAAGQRALKALDADDATFVRELQRLRQAVGGASSSIHKLDAQIDTLSAKLGEADAEQVVDEGDKLMARLFEKDEKRLDAVVRFNELDEELEVYQNITMVEGGRKEARAAIQDVLDEALKRIGEVVNARARRIEKLEKSAAKFDETAWKAQRDKVVARMAERRAATEERVRNLGAEKADYETGRADFSDRAKEIANLAMDRIRGTNIRLAGVDAMQDKRGTELARTLSIPSLQLAEHGFLVSDAEQLLHAYTNTLVPDIELVRRLGPFAPDGERNMEFKALNDEEKEVLAAHEARVEAAAAKSGKPLDRTKLGEELNKIGEEYELIRENLDASIRRIRHQWGIPQNPDGFAARGVSVMLGVNALRFLGGVVWSSLSEVAKPVARYGLSRTMKAAWLPLISNWKAIRMTMREAQLAFVAVETLTAQRARDLAGLFELSRKRSKAEAGLEWATSKIGIVAGFAPWTDVMKTLSSMTLNMKLMDSIDLALNATGTTGARKEAIEFLASLGMSHDTQRAIWKEMSNGGAERINGAWVPQTDRWKSKAAVKAYRAALYHETSASIVTPGLEVPKMMNSSLFGRVLFNLQSFALASTSKTLMAGLQQRDMAVLNAVWISLALGALSYYLKAQIAGGLTRERMEQAGWREWADESLNASGILGVVGTVQQIAGDIPYLRNVTTFSGGQNRTASAGGLIDDLGGPGYDAIYTLAQIISGVEKPTRSTIHKVREMLPLQNLFYLRRLFDMLENNVGDAFNLSGRRR